MSLHKKSAFTLVELLIVITIIGILVVALLPRLTGGREKARDATRMAHLRELILPMEQMADDFLGGNNIVGHFCLSNPLFENAFRSFGYLSDLPVDPLQGQGHQWAGSGCTPFGGGYDYVATQDGYFLIAKLENENAVGEFIYEESSLPATATDFLLNTTQQHLANFTACDAPNVCTSPVLIFAR